MSGLVDYADDSSDVSSDGEIVVGALSETKAITKPATSQPGAPPTSGGPKPVKGNESNVRNDSGSAAEPTGATAVPVSAPEIAQPAYSVPPALVARFQHFTQLTMQGNDLVDALQGRMLGPCSAVHSAEPGSYSTALPSGSWPPPPDFRTLLQQAEQQEAELTNLQNAFPHMRIVPGQMHTAGSHG